jgi:hypothetical protein
MSENQMKIKAKQIDTTGGLTLQGETINRLTHTDADGKLKAAALLKIDTANARLGIGTTTPTATLDITGDTAGEAQVMIRQHNDDADGPDLVFTRSRGYEASKSTLQSGDNVGRVNAEAWTGSAYTQNGTYGWTATDTAGNSEFSLKTRVSGTFADRFAVDSAGKVKISDAYTLPDSDGTNGQVLTTNGSGALSFADAAAGGASSLNELSDATITSVTDGQFLKYDSGSSKWINADSGLYAAYTVTTTGSIATPTQPKTLTARLTSASAQTITLPTGSSALVGSTVSLVNINSGEWTVSAASGQYIRGLSSAPTLAQNQALILTLVYDTVWYAIAYEEQGIDTLADVTITSPSDGQVLSYDSASSKWINANASGGGGVPSVTVSSPSTTQTLSAPSTSEEVYIYTPSAAISVNLVAAATCGAGFRYHIKNRGSFTLTIDANSTETIDGSQTYALNVAESAVTLVTDGSNWFII